MTKAVGKRRVRQRGEIQQLSSGAFRAKVYAGQDPVTKRRHYLREYVPPGPDAYNEAEKVLRRLLVEVDEHRTPRTSATVSQLLEKHFVLLDVERTTKATYQNLARTHIVPVIGKGQAGSALVAGLRLLLRRAPPLP
jgi:integrase